MSNIHLPAIDLNLLPVFEAIYREGNLTRAGIALGKTQSAVSHALRRLREITGDPLFVRTAQGMTPTIRARALAPAIRQALAIVEGGLQHVEVVHPLSLERAFRLAMSDYSAAILLRPLMAHLQATAPRVEIDVLPTSDDPQSSLESERYELLVGNQDVRAGIFEQELFTDEFMCAVGSNNGQVRTRLTLKQYSELPHILFSPKERGDRLIHEALREQHVQRRIALRVPHAMVIPAILDSGPYIVTLPSRLIKALEGPEMRLCKPPLPLPKLHVMQYWHEIQDQAPAHRWLRRVVREISQRL